MSANDELDRRQVKTRQAIRRAFLELLFETGYKDMTVGKVAERANVGRSTFYEHFRTKSNLLEDSLTVPFTVLASVVGNSAIPNGLAGLLQHFRENHALGRFMFYLPENELMLQVLARLIESRLEKIAESKGQPQLPLNLISTQIASAQFAVLIPWILGKVAISHIAIAEVLFHSSGALARSHFHID